MMNKYIEIEMLPTACGIGGSFSTIPLKRLKVSDTLCKTLKKIDVMNSTPYFLSYGIESGGLRHEIPVTDDEKMECPAMKFEHGISDFVIGGVKISSNRICLNYDRKGNILIGMDILKDWDIHIGVSKVKGKSLLLACPMENECKKVY